MGSTVGVEDLLPLMGKTFDDPEVSAFLRGTGTPATVENFPPTIVVSYEPLGFSINFNGSKKLSAAHFYISPQEGFEEFRGSLIRGLGKKSTREQIRSVLGAPEKSSDEVPCWDRFSYEGRVAHFQFGDDGELVLVTLMDPGSAP